MHKELVFTMKDLRFVRITCQSCGTQVHLDFSIFKKVGTRNVFTPRSCPACDLAFDSALQHLDAIQDRYASLADLGNRVEFCVSLGE